MVFPRGQDIFNTWRRAKPCTARRHHADGEAPEEVLAPHHSTPSRHTRQRRARAVLMRASTSARRHGHLRAMMLLERDIRYAATMRRAYEAPRAEY